MKTGDFSLDPFGVARPGTFNGTLNVNRVGDLTNPYSPTPHAFSVCWRGAPLPALADGTQAPGTPCNLIPANMFDPVGQKLLQLYPTSNASNGGLGINFTNVPVRSLDEGEFDVRLDHNFSSKDSLFARFSYDQATSFVPGGSPGFAEQSAFASTQDITNHGRNAALSETHIFSDRTINQATFGFNRIFNHIKSFGDSTCEAAKLGILGANLDSRCPGAPPGLSQSTVDCVSCGLTSIDISGGYWSLGDRGFAPFQGGTNVYSFSDTLDMIRGKHDVRVGMGIRLNQMNVLTNGFQDGFLLLFAGTNTGDDAANLLLGQVDGAIHDQTFEGATTGRRWKMFRPFVQDDWRVTSNLTVNLGLAWALVTPETEAQNRQANFNFNTGKYLVAGNSPEKNCAICVPSDGAVGVQFDKTALEPRIGLAWKPFGNQNTSVRAGYAIFHDSSWNQGAQGLWENPPYFAESDNFSGLCPFGNATSAAPLDCGLQRAFLPGFTAQPDPSTFTGTIQSMNLNFKQGMVQQFNLNVEHQLPGDVVLTAGYAGSRSTHILVGQVNENIGSPSACDPTSTNFTPGYTLGCAPGGGALVAPYGPFTTVDSNNDAGRARYDSLQIKAETKSARHGLYALLGYTWARTFDTGFPDGVGTSPGATYWPLPGNAKSDWSLSQLNLNNQFTASVIYDLPFGKGKSIGSNWNGAMNAILGNWQVNVIEKVTSGFPLFVVGSANDSGVNFQWNGSSLNRPNQVGDPNKAGQVAANPTCVAPAQIHTVANWFNPCAFEDAPPGQLGDSARAPISGPNFVNTDFSAVKNFILALPRGYGPAIPR